MSSDKKHEIYLLDKFNIRSKLDYKDISLPRVAMMSIYYNNNNYSDQYQYNHQQLNVSSSFFSEDIFSLTPPKYMCGCFENRHYFDEYKKDIREMFTLKEPLNQKNEDMLHKIKNSLNSVCIHIRRGDNIKQSVTGILHSSYFQKAIDTIIEKVSEKGEGEDAQPSPPSFFVFSDDLDWCKRKLDFRNHPFEFVNINSVQEPYFELELMKNCKHFIRSQGTFSFWATYLCENEDKIIIQPNLTLYYLDEQQTKEEIEYSQDAFKVTDCRETILIETRYLRSNEDKEKDI
jgi:hypothetical protein